MTARTLKVPPKGPLKCRTYNKPIVPDFAPKQDRICVLTGASGYLGSEFIKRCALDYKIIAITNKHPIAQPPQVVDPLYTSFPIVFPTIDSFKVDLTKPKAIDKLCGDIIKTYGGIDVLINAACHRDFKHLLSADGLDQLDTSYSVNVLAPIRLAVGFARKFWALQPPTLNAERKRNVINISSTAGSYVYPDSNQSIYSATKASLNYLSYHMASEFWEMGVRVNNIAPNTFPGIVSTHSVLDAMEYFDSSDATGEFKLIDRAEPDAALCPGCGIHLD
jgi:NAD(P)-dependent dehydrogenase (short-subunit alcohol dehydrogenase family)